MEKSAPAASTQLVYAVSAWVTLNYLTNNTAANWLVCASIQFMNAITYVSKQTNMMVTKMLTWLKNEFQTSGWHHCGCLSVIHNLWLYTQGCWHRNHLTEKYFHLKWLSYSVDGNHRFTELDHTAAHFPLFSEEVFQKYFSVSTVM